MSYIGSIPTTAAFPFDQFSGTGSQTAFTLTYAPAGTTSILVSVSGVMQNPNTYGVIGTTLTFTGAPPSGTSNIAVLYLGLPVIGVSSPGNTAYRTPQDFTATASQTTFTTAGAYTVGFVDVYRNGARLGNADFTATNGTTVVLANACTAGDLVTIVYFTLTSIVDALPQSGGTITGSLVVNGGVNLAAISGNVGIGTASPNFNAVNGTVCHINNSTVGAWAVNHYTNGTTGSTATDGLIVGNVAKDAYVFNYENAPIIFGTNVAERMRLDESGNLLVGTTSAAPSSAPENSRIVSLGSSSQAAAHFFTDLVSKNLVYFSRTAFGVVGTISVSGSSTSYNTSSDYRLKNTIAPMTGALAKVALLKPCTYKWNADNSDGQGFIAHELAEVEPGCVTGEKDAVDAEGKPQYQGIDTSFLVATLTAAIQEQQAMIEELKTRIAALEVQP